MNMVVSSAVAIVLGFSLASCGGGSSGAQQSSSPGAPSPASVPPPVQVTIDFINPRPVQILGYSGHAMEPHISRDGEILFFNNLNAEKLADGSDNDTNIYYATRTELDTYQYMGPVVGASEDNEPGVNELEGVPSLTSDGELYFVRTTDYLNQSSENYLKSVFSGSYANGNVVNIQSHPNFRNDRPDGEVPKLGELVFDVDINEDGSELYFAAGNFANGLLEEAHIGVAVRGGDGFTVSPDSASLMAEVNTGALEYAATTSTNSLELYFSRATLSSGEYRFGIFVSTRDVASSPWGKPKELELLTGEVVEAPSLSKDGSSLFFHQKVDGKFQLFLAERKK